MLAMLGWNPGDDRELFTMDELVQAFSMDHVQKAGAKFNPDKAKWYNKEYLRQHSDKDLTERFIPILEQKGITVTCCGGHGRRGMWLRGNCRLRDQDIQQEICQEHCFPYQGARNLRC